MSKYDALTEFLNRQLADRVRLLLDDIEDEDKIGVQLPKAAREPFGETADTAVPDWEMTFRL